MMWSSYELLAVFWRASWQAVVLAAVIYALWPNLPSNDSRVGEDAALDFAHPAFAAASCACIQL